MGPEAARNINLCEGALLAQQKAMSYLSGIIEVADDVSRRVDSKNKSPVSGGKVNLCEGRALLAQQKAMEARGTRRIKPSTDDVSTCVDAIGKGPDSARHINLCEGAIRAQQKAMDSSAISEATDDVPA